MPEVISNKLISSPEDKMYLMDIAGDFSATMGQFYMLRSWGSYPTLSRPISVHDIGSGYISFMYRQIGEGTGILSSLKPFIIIGTSGLPKVAPEQSTTLAPLADA